MIKKIVFLFYGFFFFLVQTNVVPTNLLNPYDIVLEPRRCKSFCIQNSLTYEYTFAAQGFQEDDEFSDHFRKRGNVLQLWQGKQNLFAALEDSIDAQPELTQLIVDAQEVDGLCVAPSAHFKGQSLLWATRFYINHNFNIGIFIPFYFLHLGTIHWQTTPQDEMVVNELLRTIEQIGNLDVFNGWKRNGIGDCAALVSWYQNYRQYGKRWLRNVEWNLRGGLIFPTGKKRNEDVLFGLGLGNDAGTGILAAGRLDLQYGPYIHLGIDGEFSHFFGKTHMRRIKSTDDQTDLLFVNKVTACKEYGFIQHYTLYFNVDRIFHNLSLRCAYQYTKRTDDKLYLCSYHFNPAIVNSAESLQEYTTHHGFFGIRYEPSLDSCSWNPSLTLFYKVGFNGKRAIVTDSLGFELSINF